MDEALAALELNEGVMLGHALVASVAARRSVRALAIKGPVTTKHELRAPRDSVDVDFMVDPAGLAAVQGELEMLGWVAKVVFAPGVMSRHSVTLRNPTWPCELDIHYRFPGFFAESPVVFERLWERRVHIDIAGFDCNAVDRVGSIAISALHLLRDRHARRGEFEDLIGRVELLVTDAELADLALLASSTGATETLEPLLRRLGVASVQSVVAPPEGLDAWRVRTSMQDRRSVAWVYALINAPRSERGRLLRQAIFLSESALRASNPDLPKGLRGILIGHFTRWWRGLLTAPRVFIRLKRSSQGR